MASSMRYEADEGPQQGHGGEGCDGGAGEDVEEAGEDVEDAGEDVEDADEDVEEEAAGDFDEAAFVAETRLFLTPCDAHRLAVRSLVQDLIEQSEAPSHVDEEDDGKDEGGDAAAAAAAARGGDVRKQKIRVRNEVPSGENSSLVPPGDKLTASSSRKRNLSSKPVTDPSAGVKTPSPLQNKRSLRTCKNSLEKPLSYAARQIASSSRKAASTAKPSAARKDHDHGNQSILEECTEESEEYIMRSSSLRRSVSSLANGIYSTNGRRKGNKPIRKLVFLDQAEGQKDVNGNVNGKPSLGSFFSKLTKQALSSGNNLETALDLIRLAVKHYEKAVSGGIEGNRDGIGQSPGFSNAYHVGDGGAGGGIEKDIGDVKGSLCERNSNDLEENNRCNKANHAQMKGYQRGRQRNQAFIGKNHGGVKGKCGSLERTYSGIGRNQGVTKANCDIIKARLDLATSLHAEAAILCSLGQHKEAAHVLERSISVPNIELGGCQHALAMSVSYMHLGDTFTLLGKREEAFTAYHAGLEIQMVALGNRHPQIGKTCRYLAEAHAQALQFDKAEILCRHALDIWRVNGASGSLREASDRLLMGLICNESGKHKAALEHFMLARKSFRSSGDKTEEGLVEASIGDTFVSLGYLDKAVSAYQKALTTFKSNSIITKDSRVDIASVYVSLAGVYMRLRKVQESRCCCETALRIYAKNSVKDEVVAGALTEIATIYEAQDEHKEAVSLLKKAICMLAPIPGRTNVVAGVEAQIGIIEYLHRNYGDAHSFLSKAVLKLRASGQEESSSSSLLGMVLNHMGLVYIQLADVQQAVRMFEESKDILEAVYGSHHPETLSVYSNLAGAYDALGRLDDAIGVLSYSLEARKGFTKGSGCIEVEEDEARLMELLKARRATSSVELNIAFVHRHHQ